jgi:hypothetical protein
MNDHAALIDKFVASFPLVARGLSFFEATDPIAAQLAVGPVNKHGMREWRPTRVITDAADLDPLYGELPARFPPLYEHLVLTYRWADVDLESFTLLANPPGDGLTGLLHHVVQGDGHLTTELAKNGYIQFGRATGGHYDPVCFETKSRKNRDYRVVKIDHEEILCNHRIKVVSEIAPSFRALVLQTIKRAKASRKSGK